MTIYSNNYTPYTYFIEWSKTKMKYYGVRFAQNCNPDDFWVDYFTSSVSVKDYIKEHGQPDIRQIRRVFSCPEKARLWEHKVLKRLRVVSRTDYLNKSDGKAVDMQDPVIRENHKRGIELYHSQPGVSEFKSQIQKVAQNKPELIEIKRKTKLNNWKDQEWRKKQTEAIKQGLNNPKTKKAMETAQQNLWKDEDFRNKQIELRNRPEVKEAQRKAKLGTNNHRCDMTLFYFQHKDGKVEHLTKYEFRTKYNITLHFLGKILNGETVKDWTLLKPSCSGQQG